VIAQEDEMESLLLSIREAAAALSVSRSRVYQLIQTGDLAAVRVGGPNTTRIRRADLENFAAGLPTQRRESAAG
jgi:excisionase family DNA binding protein